MRNYASFLIYLQNMKNFKLTLLTAAVRFLAMFPLKVHYFWADVIAWVLRSVVGYRRDVVAINMGRSFPSTACYYDDIERFSKLYYRHMAEIIVEAIWFFGANPKKMMRSSLVTVTNSKVLEEAWNSAPSVVILYSHCGNWELMGGIPHSACADSPAFPLPESSLRCVYKRLNNALWDDFFKASRMSMSVSEDMLLESRQLLRYMLTNRKERLAYFLNIDQSPYVSAVEIGNFMNQPTKAFLGPAEIAHKLGFAVLYMNFERISRGHYDVSFTPICMDASEMEPKEIIRKYYDCLEDEIYRHPDNWLWSHKRWKDFSYSDPRLNLEK